MLETLVSSGYPDEALLLIHCPVDSEETRPLHNTVTCTSVPKGIAMARHTADVFSTCAWMPCACAKSYADVLYKEYCCENDVDLALAGDGGNQESGEPERLCGTAVIKSGSNVESTYERRSFGPTNIILRPCLFGLYSKRVYNK